MYKAEIFGNIGTVFENKNDALKAFFMAAHYEYKGQIPKGYEEKVGHAIKQKGYFEDENFDGLFGIKVFGE